MWRGVSGTVGGGRNNGSNGSRTVVSSDRGGEKESNSLINLQTFLLLYSGT